MLLQYSRRDLPLLGRLMIKKYPEIAAELLSSYNPAAPFDDNLTNVSHYYSRYNTFPDFNKRVFVGVMVAIYSPESLRNDDNQRKGLITTIAQVLNLSHQYISLLAKESILYYKIYDDFREKVDIVTEQMKGGADGEG